MKNRFLYIALCAAGILGGATSCNDYLETKSPSTNDADFVFSNITTAQAALNGAKYQMHGAFGSHIFGDGLYYAADIAGSDIMRHPEAYSNQPGRHIPEGFYRNGTEAGTYGLLSYQRKVQAVLMVVYSLLLVDVMLSQLLLRRLLNISR